MKKSYAVCIVGLLWALFNTGCSKEKEKLAPAPVEVVFGVSHIESIDIKTAGDEDFICPLDEDGNLMLPTHAEIVITSSEGVDNSFAPSVFYLSGRLYTQAIKLDPGDYMVTRFRLRAGLDGPVIMSTPATNSPYANYITHGKTVAFPLTVEAYHKLSISTEVLCYWPGGG